MEREREREIDFALSKITFTSLKLDQYELVVIDIIYEFSLTIPTFRATYYVAFYA